MTLTFRSDPRISRDHFASILAQGTTAGPSPMAPIASELYTTIVSAKLDPALVLAILAKESQYGCTGIAPKTRNPGNVKTAYVPARSTAVLNGFAVYPSWQIAIVDLCDRLNLRYIARGLNTPETVIPVYAPPSENDTAGYIAFVNAHVLMWQAKEAHMQTTGYADRDALIKPGDNRPGLKLTGRHACVAHETDNENPGATAAMHFTYWNVGGSGRRISSVHFVADANEALQLIPIDEVSENLADGVDQPRTDESFFTVAGEICVNSRVGFASACRRMAKVFAKVLHAWGLPVVDGVTLRKHGSYPTTTHTWCPKHLNKGDWDVNWSTFVAMVQQEYRNLDGSPPPMRFLTAVLPANIRQAPTTTASIAGQMKAGESAGFDSDKEGESIQGNSRWCHLATGLGFVWSGLLQEGT